MKPNIILKITKRVPFIGRWLWNKFDMKHLHEFKPCESCRHFQGGEDITQDRCLKSGMSCNATRGNVFKCGFRGEWRVSA